MERNVPVYDAGRLHDDRETAAELVRALADGPCIVVLEGAFPDPSVVDRATAVFDALIAEQRASGTDAGDHFAAPRTNDRVWNALEKAALHDAEAFADYYANDAGPGRPGLARPRPPGHLPDQRGQPGRHGPDCAPRLPPRLPLRTRSPPPIRRTCTASPRSSRCRARSRTATCPWSPGPRCYLPHSQKYEPGYLAWRLPEFRAYFEAHHVQLPLAKGDAVFFNPALFHAAGTNRSAHPSHWPTLLQVSSAFGRAMETVDREAVANAVYPVLLKRRGARAWTSGWLKNVIAASAEGYPFPPTSTAIRRSTVWPRPRRRMSYGGRCAREWPPEALARGAAGRPGTPGEPRR